MLAAAPVSCVVVGGGSRCISLTAVVIWAYPLSLIYAIPTAVALWRRKPGWRIVAAVNLLLGWSVVGWVVAFLMAAREEPAGIPAARAETAPGTWTPESWSPPPAGYPHPGLAMTVAEPAPPEYIARSEPETAAPATVWAGITDAPAWVREGNWAPDSLVVRLCGGFEAYSHGERVGDGLSSKQAVFFVWLTVLLSDLLSPGRALRRDTVADETSPGLDRSSQRSQLSDRLYTLGGLDPGFARAIRADRQALAIDRNMGGADGELVTDLAVLHGLAETAARDGRYLGGDLAAVERLLDASQDEVLPEWGTLDDRVARRRGTAAELIEAVRTRHREDLASVTLAAAQTHLEAGNAGRAAELLRSVLSATPDREDVARRLVAALTAAGRLKEAEAARAEFLD